MPASTSPRSGKRLVIDPWLNEPTYWSARGGTARRPILARISSKPITSTSRTGTSITSIPRRCSKFEKHTTAVVPKFPISGSTSAARSVGLRTDRRAAPRRAAEARRRFLAHQLSSHFSRRQRRGRRSRRHGARGSQRRKPLPSTWRHVPGEVSEGGLHAAQPLAGVVISDALHVRGSGRPASGRREDVHGGIRRRGAAAAAALRRSVRERHLPPAPRGASTRTGISSRRRR